MTHEQTDEMERRKLHALAIFKLAELRREAQRPDWGIGALALVVALALVAVAMAGGCATLGSQTGVVTEPQDGQDEAVDIVWRQVYRRKEQAPRVAWHTVSDCTTSGGAPGFKAPTIGGNGCVAGITESTTTIHVFRSPGQPYSSTSLAHELYHAALAYQLIADPLHVTEGWAAPACTLEMCRECVGTNAGIVQRASAALQAAGL